MEGVNDDGSISSAYRSGDFYDLRGNETDSGTREDPSRSEKQALIDGGAADTAAATPGAATRRRAPHGAAAAIGSEDEVYRQLGLARGMGLCQDRVRLAEETGAAFRHDGSREPADPRDRQ